MIHLAPAPGTSRFLCCFQSSLMLKPGDTVTEDPLKVTCVVEIEYEAFERLLTAPMTRHETMAVKVKELVWEMLVERRLNNAFQVPPESRRDFLETFGKRLRKLEETDEDAGKDLLAAIRKTQIIELKRIGKGFREHSAKLSMLLMKVLQANPAFDLEAIPQQCATPGPDCGHKDCAEADAMRRHNALIREIEKLLTADPLA